MKSLLLSIAAGATLAGCAAYGDPYGYGYGYPGVSGSVYYSNTPDHRRGAYGHDGRQYRNRDRDRDGVVNRADSDRDGDGVPDAMDRRPNNPRRR